MLLIQQSAQAAVLPEDRADLLYHSYDGGGAEISGPSLLVRKKFSENLSATYNHYVDNVSSASIDVITTASPYTENREENSLSLDLLHDKTLMNLSYTLSKENDYDAETLNMGISQDMFGDLTTLSMGFALGSNIVSRNGDPDFSRDTNTRSYRLSLTQVMSKDLLMSFAYEAITDDGFLNNPYRSVRYLDSGVSRGYSYRPEIYPNTRISHAAALRGRYYLQHRAALHGGYRLFTDTWGINAHTFELGYTMPYHEDWIVELSYRYYQQTRADFYSDLFQNRDEFLFMARDKEMSSFSSNTVGVGASYEFRKNGTGLIKKGSINLNYDLILFDYEDFRDVSVAALPGEEPLYSFNANVIRFFLSIWY